MRYSGFTLIELLIALALVSILATAATYTYSALIERNLLSHHLGVWIKTLRFARTHALATGRQTTICQSNDGSNCSNRDYENGWLVFAENAGGTSRVRDTGEPVLEAVSALDSRLSLRSNITRPVSFYADGHASGNGRFVLCLDKNPDRAAGVFITYTGRVRVAREQELTSCL